MMDVSSILREIDTRVAMLVAWAYTLERENKMLLDRLVEREAEIARLSSMNVLSDADLESVLAVYVAGERFPLALSEADLVRLHNGTLGGILLWARGDAKHPITVIVHPEAPSTPEDEATTNAGGGDPTARTNDRSPRASVEPGASADAGAPGEPDLLVACEVAAQWFREYEAGHREKAEHDPAALAKAARNSDRAELLELAVARARGRAPSPSPAPEPLTQADIDAAAAWRARDRGDTPIPESAVATIEEEDERAREAAVDILRREEDDGKLEADTADANRLPEPGGDSGVGVYGVASEPVAVAQQEGPSEEERKVVRGWSRNLSGYSPTDEQIDNLLRRLSALRSKCDHEGAAEWVGSPVNTEGTTGRCTRCGARLSALRAARATRSDSV